jgi:hypothetical protein
MIGSSEDADSEGIMDDRTLVVIQKGKATEITEATELFLQEVSEFL